MKEKQLTAEVEVSKAIERFWRPFLGAIVAALIGYGAYLLYAQFEMSKEETAQEAYFALQKKIEDKSRAIASDKAAVKNSETLQKNFSDVLNEGEAFVQSYAGRKASYMAAIQLAGLLVEYKDYARAEKLLTSAAASLNENDFFSGLLRTQLGSILLETKKYDAAVEQFQKIVSAKKLASFHPHALLRLGTTYLEAGSFDKAEATFVRVEQDHPQTSAAQDAKSFRRLVKIKRGT